MSLSEETRTVVKSTIPILRTQGTDIIQTFYRNIFIAHPSVKRQFNVDRQSDEYGVPTQVAALTNAVLLYAKKIDNLEPIIPSLRPIAGKHVSRGVTAEQYEAVGECLLGAMKEVLGDGATEVVLSAWGEAYAVLKDVFIELENEIRKTNEERAGWEGMKEVEVIKIGSRDDVRLLTLDVVVPDCKPGMFVSVAIKVGEEDTMTSVKIDQVDDGITVIVERDMERASKVLFSLGQGDRIGISVPCGDGL